MHKLPSKLICLLVFFPSLLMGQAEPIDLGMVYRIKQEGLKHSQVEDLAFWFTDYSGPRLSASKGGERAFEMSRDKMEEIGLENVSIERARDFARGGWDNYKTYVAMTSPYYVSFASNPVAWTGSTKGLVQSDVVLFEIRDHGDFEKYKGKLKQKIVLVIDERVMQFYELLPEIRKTDVPYTDQALKKLAMAEPPPTHSSMPDSRNKLPTPEEIDEFIRGEGPLVILRLSKGGSYNVPRSTGVQYCIGEPEPVPELNLPLEAFGRMERLIRHGIPVEMEVEIKNKFTDTPFVCNVIGEIPGTDPLIKDEIVLIGAHLDCWHGGTGAVDNAAGCITMMEAMRILKSLNVKPGRTIRIALWGGEEQGLNGSRGYVEKYLVNPETGEHKPGYDEFSVYFNSDHLTGKFRGIYLQENDLVRPVFEAWLKPFADMGCTTLSVRNFWNTDHISFEEVNLPAFTFIQDQGEFGRGFSTTMDTYERLLLPALKQNSTIMASLAYHAAMRDYVLPRKPIN